MAVLHRKEEKIQAVLGRLPKKYTQEQFIEMFIKLYSKDWGKIKSAYIKQSQDKEPGAVINMPKPEIYLKQILEIYLGNKGTEENQPATKKEALSSSEPKKTKETAKKTTESDVKKPATKLKKATDKK